MDGEARDLQDQPRGQPEGDQDDADPEQDVHARTSDPTLTRKRGANAGEVLASETPMDRWDDIDEMVSQLGDLYAVEIEAAEFPEVAEKPAILEVRLAVRRATREMTLVAAAGAGQIAQIDRARTALDEARGAARAARMILAQARAARNRND